jgi:hypothetical protein
MQKDTSSSFVILSQPHHSCRSETPKTTINTSAHFLFTPYPLYRQKIRSLLKPPEYSRNPPKFMSAREPRSEFEKKEASTQVKLLKKTFNTMHQRFNSFSRTLTILKSEVIRVNALRAVGENDLENLQKKSDELQAEENVMLEKINEEYQNNVSYKHMRERMRQTLMYLEVKNQYLSEQIKMRDILIEYEQRKKTKTLENKFTKAQAYRLLHKTVQLDMKDRSQDLGILQEDIKAREKIHELRKTRLKKYEEIAETAANEERDLKNNNKRAIVLANILWAKFLQSKERFIREKYAHIERAYHKIRASTQISSPEEIFTRFVSKEERYVNMMETLNANKEKCLKYLEMNDLIEEKVSDLLLTQQNALDSGIHKLKERVHEGILKMQEKRAKLKKTKLVADTIREWVFKKISASGGKVSGDEKLFALFSTLSQTIRSKIHRKKVTPFITEVYSL